MRLLLAASFAVAIGATPVTAQTMFDGTWKVDVSSAQLPTKPFGWTLARGMYSCTGCNEPYRVSADGAFHKVVGQPYWDEIAVDAANPRVIKKIYKKGGKITDTFVQTLSPDGRTLTWHDTDTSAPNGKIVEGSGKSIRVSAAPSGSHALSGMWRAGPVTSISDAGVTMSFKTRGKTVTMTTPAGYTYTAMIGGPAVPVSGDLGHGMAALKMPNPKTLVETDSRDGKTTGTVTFVVQPGGKTMTGASYDTKRGTTVRYTAMKQ